MGSPWQIAFNDHNARIYFYCHWGGYEVEAEIILRDALLHAKPRWDDAPYAIRMILSYILAPNIMEETGYGISTQFMDEMIPTYILDMDTLMVYRNGDERKRVSFQDFVDDCTQLRTT